MSLLVGRTHEDKLLIGLSFLSTVAEKQNKISNCLSDKYLQRLIDEDGHAIKLLLSL